VLETTETARRRLAIRAWRRGTREMDLILGPFADARLGAMPPAEVAAFEALIAEEDTDLLAWVLGQAAPPDRHASMIDALRRHAADTRRN
jgi:antitoxin CptB